MLLLDEQVILDMFLIHLVLMLNFDLSIKWNKKNCLCFCCRIKNIITRKEPVEAILGLAVDANDPRLGWRLKPTSLP